MWILLWEPLYTRSCARQRRPRVSQIQPSAVNTEHPVRTRKTTWRRGFLHRLALYRLNWMIDFKTVMYRGWSTLLNVIHNRNTLGPSDHRLKTWNSEWERNFSPDPLSYWEHKTLVHSLPFCGHTPALGHDGEGPAWCVCVEGLQHPRPIVERTEKEDGPVDSSTAMCAKDICTPTDGPSTQRSEHSCVFQKNKKKKCWHCN